MGGGLKVFRKKNICLAPLMCLHAYLFAREQMFPVPRAGAAKLLPFVLAVHASPWLSRVACVQRSGGVGAPRVLADPLSGFGVGRGVDAVGFDGAPDGGVQAPFVATVLVIIPMF